MRELGAQSFYDFGAADEAMGLEDSVEPWLNGLWSAFDSASGPAGESAESVETDTCSEVNSATTADSTTSLSPSATVGSVDTTYLLEHLISYEKMFGPLETPTEVPEDLPRLQSSLLCVRFLSDKERKEFIAPPETNEETDTEISSTNPFVATVFGAEYLTAPHSERKVLRLDIDISGSGINYAPGDSIGIKCPNRTEDVVALLACLGISGDTVFSAEPVAATNGRVAKKKNTSIHFPSPCSIRDAFLHHVDILSSPKKAVVCALATYCSDEEQRAQMLLLSSKAGTNKYKVRMLFKTEAWVDESNITAV
ncbi:unnamed protein product [Phytophthora fragariaefolia]|uniref:Unnamed protein product n=1 Tax=Phytophthora fragariaefolia TaxID=1490495 RepID=A0A9W6U9G1_9STRA|nr:unnamed protein product [Phytophthora fragariaefolia]